MIKWFTGLSSGYLWIASGIVIAIILGYIALLKYQNNSLRADLANSTAQVTILSASIESQNQSINQLSKDSLERTQKAQEALNKANVANGINQSKITSLKSQIGKFKSCDSASDYAKGLL